MTSLMFRPSRRRRYRGTYSCPGDNGSLLHGGFTCFCRDLRDSCRRLAPPGSRVVSAMTGPFLSCPSLSGLSHPGTSVCQAPGSPARRAPLPGQKTKAFDFLSEVKFLLFLDPAWICRIPFFDPARLCRILLVSFLHMRINKSRPTVICRSR